MNQHLQSLLQLIRENASLSEEDKKSLVNAIQVVEKDLNIISFKLDKTEKAKKTTAILLEETIAELEQKRHAVEKQKKDLEIEAALERVRSVAMGMNKPEDMLDVCRIISDQLQLLRIPDIRNVQTAIIDVGGPFYRNYQYFTQYQEGTVENTDYRKHRSVQQLVIQMQQSPDAFFTETFEGEELNIWRQYRKDDNQFPDPNLDHETGVYFYFYSIGNGGLGISTYTPLKEEGIVLFKRFRNVFNLAYRRYLDIEHAAEQAREAHIEAALEKVRGRAMAMHNSSDLSITAAMVFTELRKLGIDPIRCGVGLVNKENRRSTIYAGTKSGEGDTLSLSGYALLDHHPIFAAQFDNWINQTDYFPVLKKEDVREYYAHLSTDFKVPEYNDKIDQYGFYLPFSEGFLFGWTEQPLSPSEISILNRFKSIIDLTFRRYLDLQKSESNAREAIKQASLDRLRAEIASMRTTSDLEKITPIIWNELTILGVPFVRCGVFIMDEAHQHIHTFLSTPEGKAIAAFHLPYSSPGNLTQALVHWKKKEKYIDHWNEEEFKSFAQILVKEGALADPEQYLSTMPKGGFYLHFLPFLQGMLYVGNTDQLGEQELQMIQSVADAFSTAYARYEDFNMLEAAKLQVEKTLVELKQTQQQLIQSEKMASLGELTAGIAHEIQNPLNFVNNFSEVNAELIDELHDELATGNFQLAKEIAGNIKDNEEKIIFHGKRADAIVKGMLQHSRSSSGVKEPTDINALADEYLRLAYHGLRAKDKTFNATMKTDLDQSIGLVNIIPQDIGRVLLNLITNAFYAVTEKKKFLAGEYEPTVNIVTKATRSPLGDLGVEVRVHDNGLGIPEEIKDKIFQPFFTTKPTGQGTGLGLSLSYDIVKAHGGELKVETKEGEGTEFIIRLP